MPAPTMTSIRNRILEVDKLLSSNISTKARITLLAEQGIMSHSIYTMAKNLREISDLVTKLKE